MIEQHSSLLPFLPDSLQNHKTIYHTFTTGYDPQAHWTAERSVGLVESLAARALASANLDKVYWSYAVRSAAQSLMCHALQKTQRPLPFRCYCGYSSTGT